jgi:hypothetical protein
MNRQRWLVNLLVVALLAGLVAGAGYAQEAGPQAAPLGTGFTYQGRLQDAGGPINGACDFTFELYDQAGSGSPPSGGTLLDTQALDDVTVADGYFTVGLDFGAEAFSGQARWLQVTVDCGEGATTLSPRPMRCMRWRVRTAAGGAMRPCQPQTPIGASGATRARTLAPTSWAPPITRRWRSR